MSGELPLREGMVVEERDIVASSHSDLLGLGIFRMRLHD